MPYRVDVPNLGRDAFDTLVQLGALDAEWAQDGGIAALLPDSVTPQQLASALGIETVSVSPATPRDGGSVWVLSPRPVRVGSLLVVPAHMASEPDALRLVDASAFGTGLHPTTRLCLEALDEAVQICRPDAALDVGTGSGVLALAALRLGVRRAVGIDVDREALRVAAENARVNGLSERLRLVRGGPEAIRGTWPLVLANIQAAPLMEMAPEIVRRLGHHGRLVLSGIPRSVESEVHDVYRGLGLRRVMMKSRAAWAALVLQASW